MKNFFRFPSTPHLAWLANSGMPRDDKVLSRVEAESFLSSEVIVEEKLDGANLGISLGLRGDFLVQNRGQYLSHPFLGQFARFPDWLAMHENGLREVLSSEIIIFGEWCAARHSLRYERLPDWFLLFDVYDRGSKRFWSTSRRNSLARRASLFTVPLIGKEITTLSALEHVVMESPSAFRSAQPLEGVIVRRESNKWCECRAKLVRPDFAQAMDEHWRKRNVEWNRIDWTQTERT